MIPWFRWLWVRWKRWTQDPPIPFERRDYSGRRENDNVIALRDEDRDD